MVTGCRVERSIGGLECLCGVGCEREFPFGTQAECEASIKCECKKDQRDKKNFFGDRSPGQRRQDLSSCQELSRPKVSELVARF